MKTHQTCPSCGHHGCMTEFEDGNTYCHSCHTFTPSEGWAKLDESGQDVEFSYKSYRGIDRDVAEFYGILTGEVDGEEMMRVYPYPHRVKNRKLPKDFSANKGFENTHLFGMDKFQAGASKAITIVEGEDDVPSAYQILGKSWPVVGIPGSSSPKKLLAMQKGEPSAAYKFLDAYKSIVVAMDGDGAGKEAAMLLARAFPNKVYFVDLATEKDPNDYLTKGKSSEFLYSWLNRQKYVPDNILNTSAQFLSLFREAPDHLFTPTGISELDEKINGIMRGYFTVFKAKTGIGKTELMRKIEYSMLKQGVPIASWHLEETKLRSVLGLASYELGDNVTQKDVIEEKGCVDLVEEAIVNLTKDELFYQFFMRDEDGPDELIEQIKYFSEVCDVKYIFIEPIQDVVATSSEASKEEMLANLAVRLSKLAAELNIAIVTIAHTNDDGEIKYCRMIGQRAGIIIRLDRDKDATDPIEANTTYLTIEKNRPLSVEGYAGCLYFEQSSFTIEERAF